MTDKPTKQKDYTSPALAGAGDYNQIKDNDNNTTGMWKTLKHLLPSSAQKSATEEINKFFSEIGENLTSDFGELQIPEIITPNITDKLQFYEININYTLKELLALP